MLFDSTERQDLLGILKDQNVIINEYSLLEMDELQDITNEELSFADEREDIPRIGCLLRIGEYLTYHSNPRIKGFGEKLKSIGFRKLATKGKVVQKELEKLSTKDLETVFLKVELHDILGLADYFKDARSIKEMASLVQLGCHHGYDGHYDLFLPV